MKKLVIFFLALSLTVVSCKEEGKKVTYKPASIGAINSLTVVIDNDLWNGPVGDKVREHFAAPVLGLSWEEPLFTINQLPKKVFTGAIRHTRSILFVDLDSVNVAHVKSDMYARPQKVGVIKGKTEQEIMDNLDKKADEIIAAFKDLEIEEAQKRFKRSVNKENALQENFGISLTIPSAYKVGKREDNFVWIDRQIQRGHMNIIVYSMPEDTFKNDSTFVKDIVSMRDSIGELYIPGADIPGKKTYMITEKAFAPYVFPTEIAGLKAAEVRGIWEVKNDFMSGPFIMYIVNDKKNNRKLILEGFTFAPATEKRDDMFELEAILKTLKIN